MPFSLQTPLTIGYNRAKCAGGIFYFLIGDSYGGVCVCGGGVGGGQLGGEKNTIE